MSFPGDMYTVVGTALASGGASYFGQMEANRANRDIASQQMDWSRELSGTAHVREVADLKAAGLNPILSVNGGASTPASVGATMINPVQGAMSTALQTAQTQKDLSEAQSRIDLNAASKQAQLAGAQRDLSTAKQIDVQTKINNAQLPAIEKEAKLRQMNATVDSDPRVFTLRKTNQYIGEGLGTANSAKSLLNPLGSGGNSGGLKIPNNSTLIHNDTGEVLMEGKP